jgi:hypothetical protein
MWLEDMLDALEAEEGEVQAAFICREKSLGCLVCRSTSLDLIMCGMLAAVAVARYTLILCWGLEGLLWAGMAML